MKLHRLALDEPDALIRPARLYGLLFGLKWEASPTDSRYAMAKSAESFELFKTGRGPAVQVLRSALRSRRDPPG